MRRFSIRGRTVREGVVALVLASAVGGCVAASDRQYFDDAKSSNLSSTNGGKYTVGGIVNGLVGGGLVLRNDGEDLAIDASGAFAFTRKANTGDRYQVTVATLPANPPQGCAVAGASGTVESSNVTNINVACSTDKFKVGGTVAGLGTGATVVLQNNSGDNLTVSADGPFSFATTALAGTAYNVTVLTQPANKTCGLAKAIGTIGTGDVADVAVTCEVNRYLLAGTASGIAAAGLTLVNASNSETLAINNNGPFSFVTKLQGGQGYDVSVGTSPPEQRCTLQNGTATMGAANVSNLDVACLFFQDFDAVTAPAIPAGWSATNSGGAPWITVGTGSDTGANHAFAPDPDIDPAPIFDNRLTSRAYPIQSTSAQLSFRHNYDTESSFDGGVLEISIAGGAFIDIIAAGGSFASNPYNVQLSQCCGNPIGLPPAAARMAWSGSSGGYVTTTVNLPASAAGKNVIFRWRLGTDDLFGGSGATPGWAVDTITLKP